MKDNANRRMRPAGKTHVLAALFVSAAILVMGSLLPGTAHNSIASEQGSSANTFEAGAFDNPATCRGCHRQIYDEWAESKHRYAWEDVFYQPDYLLASTETKGFTDVFCGECHTPAGVRTEQLPPPDGSRLDDVSKRGISCDYCHTVSEIVETANVGTISSPGRVKRGPRGDGRSPVHEVSFSEIHTDAAFCGACHNVVHPTSGVAIIDTYDDWKDGPYARQGTRCQDCHMTPGPGVVRNPGKSSPMGKEREHVATHFFPGGSVLFQERAGNEREAQIAKEMLEAAAELDARTGVNGDGIELTVTVKNTGAGHKIPTGVTYIRKMWLEVIVKDPNGDVVYTSGGVTKGNRVDPGATFYRKIFRDADGNLTPKSWLAEEIAYDNRIPPMEADEQVFNIPLTPGDGNGFHIAVRLLYRSMSQEAAEMTGIAGLAIPSVEMARTELHVTN